MHQQIPIFTNDQMRRRLHFAADWTPDGAPCDLGCDHPVYVSGLSGVKRESSSNWFGCLDDATRGGSAPEPN